MRAASVAWFPRRDALLPWALSCLIATGCGGEGGDEPPPVPPAAEEGVPEESPTGPVRIAGVLVVGENTVEFQPCQGGAPLWLDGPLVPDLVDLHGELTPGVEPFEGIFVDLVGEAAPPPAVGPGVDYEAGFLVRGVRRAAFEGWSCADVDPELQVSASGTEPFWSLRIAGSSAEFSTPEGSRTVEFGPLRADPEGWVAQGLDGEGSNVFLSMTELPCRNAMSGAYSHLTAEVEMGGRSYRGCGYLGASADPDVGPG